MDALDWIIFSVLAWLAWKAAQFLFRRFAPSYPGLRPDFYRSKAWRDLARQSKARNKRRNGTRYPVCDMCGASKAHVLWWKRRAIHTDHIKPRSTHPWLALDPDNCQELCYLHNTRKGARWGPNWRRLREWDLGFVIPFLRIFVWVVRRF